VKILRYILFPVVPLYYSVTWLRNKFYDLGVLKSSQFVVPVVCVGNLSVGGTGKTPMIEYLIRLLEKDFKVATLSRGYKRNTKGFVLADSNATAKSIGDEPFQFFSKFENILVSVDTDRCNGINKLMALKTPPQVILLDDAYQHRKVKAQLNILLTPFKDLYIDDMVLPTGNLREPKSGADRADAIIVTKCPSNLDGESKKEIVNRLKPKPNQEVFFGSIDYAGTVKNHFDAIDLETLKPTSFTLVTGIANPEPLVAHLKVKDLEFEHIKFGDHHDFNPKEIKDLSSKQLIITTEKDYARLRPFFADSKRLYYLPIAHKLDRPEAFEAMVKGKIKPMESFFRLT